MAQSRRDIEFKSIDGTTLRGWFYPAGSKSPCVVISHGLAGIKHAFLDDFAARFQASGISALVYDNRCWGDSDGLPRHDINPTLQQRDYLDAFDYAASLPEVDDKRIAYWGSSYSGGNVICAAAIDKRIRAAVVQAPFVSGEISTAPHLGGVPYLFADRANIRAGGEHGMVALKANTLEQAQSGESKTILPDVEAFQYFEEAQARGGRWENKMTMQSMFYMLSFEPKAFIHRVAPTPLLMVIAEKDLSVSVQSQLDTYELARQPKQIEVVKNAGHFDIYRGKGFEANIKVQIEFLKKHL